MNRKDKYLITGATGLIGSALVKKLILDNADVVCPIRNIEKARLMFDSLLFNKVKWIEVDLGKFLNEMHDDYDYIIHCASPTASKFFIEKPVETLLFNINTTTSILNYSRSHKLKSVVYLSSLESYGTVLDDKESIDENFQGYVNPMEVRSSYNMAKRMCESLCHAFAEEYNIPVKVIRLTQTVSPIIRGDDMRVFAQFARRAAKGEDIELHTEGTAARQYIHVDDATEAILCVLYKGLSGEVYNAAREDSYISVRDMAHFIQENLNQKGKVIFKLRKDMGYAPTTKLRLDTTKLRKLGWEPKHTLFDMFNDLITVLKNQSY